uniref:Uncharacterized protein n=1 Tax=Panagrolaimus davidi TaxID=227884 RepID=A0A914Q7Z5_9BILA
MNDSGEINGIAGDTKVVRYLYTHYKLEEEYNNTKILNRFWWYFLEALKQCFSQIDSLEMGDVRKSYMNWIRWNMVEIIMKLQMFLTIRDLRENYGTFLNMIQKIKNFEENYFQLSRAEKSVKNEYSHTINIMKEKEKELYFIQHNLRVVQKAGMLLMNYLSYLTNRYCVNSIDDESMEQLENDVNYLITALRQRDDKLASDIRTTFQNFQNFVTLDEAASIAQEELMQKAMELIDIKANQTALQNVLEQIKKIKTEAGKQMGKAIKYTDAFTLGIAIISGGVFTGLVFALDVFLIESIALGTVVYSSMLITSSAGVYFSVANLALTGGRILPFQLEAQENIKKLLEQTKPYDLIFQDDKKNDDNGNNNNNDNYDDDNDDDDNDSENSNNGDNAESGDDGSTDDVESWDTSDDGSKEEVGEEDNENQMPLTVENLMIALNKVGDAVEKELNKTDQQNIITQQEMVEIQRDQNQINEALNLSRKYLQPKKPAKNS